MLDWTPAGAGDQSAFGWMGVMHYSDVMGQDMAFNTVGGDWFMFDYQFDYWAQQYIRPFWFWSYFYTIINRANDILNLIPEETVDPRLKAIMGQAHALRAISHAYLAQLFQITYSPLRVGAEVGLNTGEPRDMPGVPIITNKEETTYLGRAPLSQVFAQVESDFKIAIELLDGWQRPDKGFIDKYVAAGLFARVSLVIGNWADAITYSRMAQEGPFSVYTMPQLTAAGFNNASSQEWMWGALINSNIVTQWGQTGIPSFFSFISFDAPGYATVNRYRLICSLLFNQMHPNDVRRSQFNSGQIPFAVVPQHANMKFRNIGTFEADLVYMRVSEMVLIEAEALHRQGNAGAAATTLGQLASNRVPGWNQSTVTIDDILFHRRVELWGEGFTLFDNLRLHRGVDRRGSNHPAGYEFIICPGSRYFLFQIPLRELDENDAIEHSEQNPSPSDTEEGLRFQAHCFPAKAPLLSAPSSEPRPTITPRITPGFPQKVSKERVR